MVGSFLQVWDNVGNEESLGSHSAGGVGGEATS